MKISILSKSLPARAMTRYCLIFILLSIFSSCAFHRAKLNGINGKTGNVLRPDGKEMKEIIGHQSDLNAKTGVYTLEGGGESFIARLWYFEHAKERLDIQYYSFSKDLTGLIACESLIRAADRGVKIRILIDDAASLMNTSEVKLLDSHENIEIKIYNAGLKLGRLDRRIMHLSKNHKRVLRRMHNKSITVDGLVSMIGGRNIADRYFDYSKKYNFRDRDIVLIGKAAKDVNASFDEFWNSELSVLYTDLTKVLNKPKYKDPKRFDDIHKFASKTKKFSPEMRDKVKNYGEELRKKNDSGELLWLENVTFVSDKPGKNEDRPGRKGGISTDTLVALIKYAKKNIEMDSPYFIMTDENKELIRNTIASGVKFRLLTNSLGSTDNYQAFSGYQRDRKNILQTGVEIHEFRPDAQVRYKLMIPEVQSKINYKAVYGFHPKSMIIDGRTAVVGSYNFDPRSANFNSECVVVIRSEKFCDLLSKPMMEEFLPENSWLVNENFNPDHKASLMKRFRAWRNGIFPKRLL